MDELRQELVKAELKIDQLVLELQSKERDLLNERNELEKVCFDAWISKTILLFKTYKPML